MTTKTDLTPTHFIPKTNTVEVFEAYFFAAEKLHTTVVLQGEKGQDMGDLIEVTLPSVQVWSYPEAPLWARINDDDADWAIFVPDHMESYFDPELYLGDLAVCGIHGPGKVSGGQVWTAHHS
jgi:hypothetical protein